MARHVYAALAQVNEAFTPRDIDLAKLERTFILDVGGGFDALVLPPLLPVVQREAPGLRLLVSNTRGGDLTKELKYGETELAFDFQACDADGIRCDLLGRSDAVVLARPDHPALRSGLTEELYFALSHVSLVWARSTAVSGVALELERIGRSPTVAVSVPTLMAMGAVAGSSDLIATTSVFVGNVLARALWRRHPSDAVPVPAAGHLPDVARALRRRFGAQVAARYHSGAGLRRRAGREVIAEQ